jgi:serine/threonine protein kinase
MKNGTILKTAFDLYTICGQLGQGGCGVVYRCTNENNNLVALKLINKNKGVEKIKRFKNEINFCQKDNGPNIIKVIDYGFYEADGESYLFYVMPLYNQSLREQMNSGLSSEKIISIFSDICNGLSKAHCNGCIHRDLKPENILIGDKGEAVIADFGIAHFLDSDKITTIETAKSSRMANFSYHAPEQINGTTSSATDIFALGLILNEMFTGKIPSGDNYVTIGSINADYSFLDKLVSKMISQNSNDRYQDVKQVLIDYFAYKAEFQNKNKILNLREPLPNDEIKDCLYFNPAVPIDIKAENGNLIIKLNNRVNDVWIDIYRDSLDHYQSLPFCYKKFQFYGDKASYSLGYSAFSYGEYIKQLISEFKKACSITNQLYKNKVKSDFDIARQDEVKRRQTEIDKIERDIQLSGTLKKLL